MTGVDAAAAASPSSLLTLFEMGASGEPIVLSDVRATALQGAQDHELRTVMLH